MPQGAAEARFSERLFNKTRLFEAASPFCR
jgi:hypothetical protein